MDSEQHIFLSVVHSSYCMGIRFSDDLRCISTRGPPNKLQIWICICICMCNMAAKMAKICSEKHHFVSTILSFLVLLMQITCKHWLFHQLAMLHVNLEWVNKIVMATQKWMQKESICQLDVFFYKYSETSERDHLLQHKYFLKGHLVPFIPL